MAEPTPTVAELPEVELEVRQGGRASSYAFSHIDFLVGTVPGCDLRVPGPDLPPVLCLLARGPSGVTLRKLAPTQILLLNGHAASHADLKDGDRITLGALDIFVRLRHMPALSGVSGLATEAGNAARRSEKSSPPEAAAERAQLQADRDAFEQVRRQQAQELQQWMADLEERERALKKQVAELGKLGHRPVAHPELEQRARDLEARATELDKQKQELTVARQELADIRRQLYDRYQERRDRLAGLQEAVNNAARKVQERKRQVEAEAKELAQGRQAQELAAADLAEREARLEAQRRTLEESQAEVRSELERRLHEVQAREDTALALARDLEKRERQYQADVLRLDRQQASLDAQAQQLAEQQRALDEKIARLQEDSVELEKQALELEDWRASLQDQANALAQQKQEQDRADHELAQRAAALEGQQATLAALRTRLERLRAEVREHEQQLEAERGQLEQERAAFRAERQAVEQLKNELELDRQVHAQQQQELLERQATLDVAVAQLRQAQEKCTHSEQELSTRVQDLERRAADLAAQETLLESRLHDAAQAQERLDAERQTLRERTQALAQAEQTREALQEQLRRRGEELAARQKTLQNRMVELEGQTAALEARRAETERLHQEAQAQLDGWRQELAALDEQLQRRQAEILERETQRRRQFEELQKLGREVAGQRKALADERAAYQQEQEAWQQAQVQSRADFDKLRQEALALGRELPDIELRAGAALERLTHAREQLRDHLSELHVYVQESREELEGLRGRLQAEEARLRDQEQALRRQQEEHRLALVAFRQQMIGWQGQIADLKRHLSTDESRLELRHAQVVEQEKQVDAAAHELSHKEQSIQAQAEEVAGKRQEIEGHLVDMREWYRKKMRELADGEAPQAPADQSAGMPSVDTSSAAADSATATDLEPAHDLDEPDDEQDSAIIPIKNNILSMTGPVEPADRKLGEVLTELQLIDAGSLDALLREARRQRRTLRQVLLASGVVTVYQLALIEAGNVAGLMLGPVRVVDRLRSTPLESVYRVFDPRRGEEALLRHLGAEQMEDAVRPDEFRQRFSQAMLDHAHVAATWEVLDIGGRPAVLQEWLSGLPASDWPPLAAAPGVCLRLFTQGALALNAIHQAGLVHGHLSDACLFLTTDGILKITGLGEPPWLSPASHRVEQDGAREPADARDDLQALGRIVSGWCTPAGVRKGPRTKPLPDSLVSILFRLTGSADNAYASAAELLADLEGASPEVPANVEAWDRLRKYVRDHAAPEAILRLSA